MNLSAICRHSPICIDLQASPREAAQAMRAHHIGTVLVVTTQAGVRHAAGVLTDRDLAVDVLARDVEASRLTVGELASKQLVAVRGSADVSEAVAAMRDHGVRRLLVTGSQGDVVGILSADDLLRVMATQLSGLSAALDEGIARESAERPSVGQPPAGPVFLPLGASGLPPPQDDD